ncbi:hypothetical protein PVAG01_01059 [Phlyctema vagabunda]|uniref:Uncharacterized protein n=1 Tax=Phlyctema vagabunda TaxID=108571 RepID=A0ABR4PWC9_9HELO
MRCEHTQPKLLHAYLQLPTASYITQPRILRYLHFLCFFPPTVLLLHLP